MGLKFPTIDNFVIAYLICSSVVSYMFYAEIMSMIKTYLKK